MTSHNLASSNPPPPPKKKPSLQLLYQTLYVMEYPCWPVCARWAGCALSKLSAHWRGREGKGEGPDAVHALLSNHQNCCVTNTLPVTPKTWDAQKEVISIPPTLCTLPNVRESTKANFYILTLEKGPTNATTGKVKMWV